MDKTYAPVTTAQELTEALAKCRAAQEKFATYTQEQVDKIFSMTPIDISTPLAWIGVVAY